MTTTLTSETEALPRGALCDLFERVLASSAPLPVRRLGGDVVDARSVVEEAGADGRRLLGAGVLLPGDTIVLSIRDVLDLLRGFFAVAWAGGVPIIVAPPKPRESSASWQERVADVAARAHAAAVLTDALLSSDFPLPAATVTGIRRGAEAPLPERAASAVAYLQTSSGSTGPPRPLAITHVGLLAQLDALAPWWGIDGSSVIANWLPLWHDFGLVGGALLSMHVAADLVIDTPDRFLAAPAETLRAMADARVTFTPLIPAALHLFARAARNTTSLPPLRSIPLGADFVRPDLVRGFEAGLGLPPGVAMPGYGLADATLGVACTRPGESWTERSLSSVDTGVWTPAEETVISLGHPISNVEMWIEVDGEVVGEDIVGHVMCQSTARCGGQWSGNDADLVPPDVPIDTGDYGFLADDVFYFVGRRAEVIRVAGEDFIPTDIEHAVLTAGVGRPGRIAAVSLREGSASAVVAVVESDDAIDGAARRAAIAAARSRGLPLADVIAVPSDWLPRTSSGKLRRTSVPALLDNRRSAAAPVGES